MFGLKKVKIKQKIQYHSLDVIIVVIIIAILFIAIIVIIAIIVNDARKIAINIINVYRYIIESDTA